MRIHHVQVSCPAGGEDAARRFYGEGLGIPEVAKPPVLAARGGCWFRSAPEDSAVVEIHVGVEAGFAPARKAHPAFVADVDALSTAIEAAGHEVRWANPDEVPGRRRFHTSDPVGNRLEFLDG